MNTTIYLINIWHKYGGGGIMIRGCFSLAGTGGSAQDRQFHGYQSIWMQNLQASESSRTKTQIQINKSMTSEEDDQHSERPTQNPDLNPVKNLWSDLKKVVNRRSVHRLIRFDQS